MDNDLDRSAERLAHSEETRASLTGFGTNKQGQAIERQFHDQATISPRTGGTIAARGRFGQL